MIVVLIPVTFVSAALDRPAPVNTAFVSVALSRLAEVRSSPVKFVPVRSLPDRSEDWRAWPLLDRSAPVNVAVASPVA